MTKKSMLVALASAGVLMALVPGLLRPNARNAVVVGTVVPTVIQIHAPPALLAVAEHFVDLGININDNTISQHIASPANTLKLILIDQAPARRSTPYRAIAASASHTRSATRYPLRT